MVPWRFLRALLVAAFLAGCAGSKEPTDPATLAKQFETFFGFKPPTTVSELQAKTVQVGDAMVDWLSFKCDAVTFERIVRTDDYKIATRENLVRYREPQIPDVDFTNPNAPSWWPKKPTTSIDRFYYYYRPYVEGKTPTQSSESYFWRDEHSGAVFAYYSAWR